MAPIYVEGDIWETMANMPKNADVVIGGFPFQDISVNGKGAGVDGKRKGMDKYVVECWVHHYENF